MSTGGIRWMVALALAPWCVAGPAVSQGVPGTPSELVRALAGSGMVGFFDDSVTVVEGRIPSKWAALLPVPPAGRVLATVFDSSAATAYVVVHGTPQAAATLVESMAAPKGWVPQQRTPEPFGPFVQQSLLRGPSQYCRGAREQLVVAPRPFGGGTLIQLLYMTGSGFACEAARARDPVRELLPPLEPPPLPAGANPMDCYGASQQSSGSSTRLVSDAGPAAILAGYGRQLEAAGWQPEAGPTAPVVGSWSKPAPGGGSNRVVLRVGAETGTRGPCRSVSMTLEQRP